MFNIIIYMWSVQKQNVPVCEFITYLLKYVLPLSRVISYISCEISEDHHESEVWEHNLFFIDGKVKTVS